MLNELSLYISLSLAVETFLYAYNIIPKLVHKHHVDGGFYVVLSALAMYWLGYSEMLPHIVSE